MMCRLFYRHRVPRCIALGRLMYREVTMRVYHIALYTILSILVWPFLVTSADAEERLALLIGNSRYVYAAPLRNPENDIVLVATSLRASQFKVTSVDNLAIADMRKT